jgi:hypothetical protein
MTQQEQLPFDIDKENKFLASNEPAQHSTSASILKPNTSQAYGSSTFLKTYRDHAAYNQYPSQQNQQPNRTENSLKRNNSQDFKKTLKNSGSI